MGCILKWLKTMFGGGLDVSGVESSISVSRGSVPCPPKIWHVPIFWN